MGAGTPGTFSVTILGCMYWTPTKEANIVSPPTMAVMPGFMASMGIDMPAYAAARAPVMDKAVVLYILVTNLWRPTFFATTSLVLIYSLAFCITFVRLLSKGLN